MNGARELEDSCKNFFLEDSDWQPTAYDAIEIPSRRMDTVRLDKWSSLQSPSLK